MDPVRYWQLKVFQLLHDPPGKPFHLAPRGKGSNTPGSPHAFLKHADLARELFSLFTEGAAPKGLTRPDHAATGADRPVLAAGWGRGQMSPLPYQDRGDSLSAHPLAPGARLHLDPRPGTTVVQPHEVLADDDLQREVARFLGEVTLPGWADPAVLREQAIVLWRRMRDELMVRSEENTAHPRADLLWALMPADTRAPDHSIWDHTRMAAALSFLDAASGKKGQVEAEKEPWLLQVSLTPVGEFIRQSKKAQDLWVSSFLLADLAWHAMLPIVKEYGPDNIVYPDLRGNPRVDHWLRGEYPKALREGLDDPSTYAAILPNTFTAVVPRGGAGHLQRVEEIGQRCVDAVQVRWRDLADVVLQWFLDKARNEPDFTPALKSAIERAWGEQHGTISSTQATAAPRGGVVQARWTAVPWMLPEPSAAAREDRLKPWVPPDVWKRYEAARAVFEKVDARLLLGERGFDYALTHHQLRVRHALRKQTAVPAAAPEQPGEKCTLCGLRTALGDPGAATHAKRAAIESRRQAVRKFWSQDWLDPERAGAERLCAVCTFKRFLVEADGHNGNGVINTTWAGIHQDPDKLKKQDGDKVRVPFPSTTAIAAQAFLADVVKRAELRPLLEEVSRAQASAIDEETQFPRALPALAAAYREAGSKHAERFLRLEPQETIFPRSLDSRIQREPDPARKEEVRRLQRASLALLKQAREAGVPEPGKRFAVIQMDGDSMGDLLLGDSKRIAATWADILHPRHLERLKKDPHAIQAGWPALLGEKRLMGPALHAFISRALADFTHQIVPWVVEQEYGGRLVYTGGDDILALAPANEAVQIAARLQQLFSAPWVADARAEDEDPWEWRRPDWRGEHDTARARSRFTVVPENASPLSRAGRILPMLGPGASLSAGITIGHFKTPLRGMLHQARHLLDEVAKERAGRSAVALSYCTRSGPKYQFAMRWGNPEGAPEERIVAHRRLELVVQAFQKQDLPSRLPYKLREAASTLHGALEAIEEAHPSDSPEAREGKERLMGGMLKRELDGKKIPAEVEQAVLDLWRSGVAMSRELRRRDPRSLEEPMLDGLLIARALASGEPEDEE